MGCKTAFSSQGAVKVKDVEGIIVDVTLNVPVDHILYSGMQNRIVWCDDGSDT